MTTNNIQNNIQNNDNNDNNDNNNFDYETSNINFSNEINSSRNNNNNININNYLSQINGVFEFYIKPLREKITKYKNEIKKLKNEIKDKNDKIEEVEKKCSVCLTNECNIIFIPCGHLCICKKCNSNCEQYNISFCPICRNNGSRYVVYT
jgi:hypothetical protein